MTESASKRVAFVTPTVTRPYPQYLAALEASLPLIEAAGWTHGASFVVGNPYISGARADLLRKALDWKADCVVFIDHDLSWDAGDLLKLIETEGDVVAGTYRFTKPDAPEEYMSTLQTDITGRPQVRADGAVKGHRVPAGFLKVTNVAVAKFMSAYPHLCYGPKYAPAVDLFNHGAHEGVWWGEDYAFSRNWIDCGGEIWIVPDLNLTHHRPDASYPGNFHQWLMRCPGGANDPNRQEPVYRTARHQTARAAEFKPIWDAPVTEAAE